MWSISVLKLEAAAIKSGLRTKMVQFENEMRLLSSLRVVLMISVDFLQLWIVLSACRSLSILLESSIVDIWFVKFDYFDRIEL